MLSPSSMSTVTAPATATTTVRKPTTRTSKSRPACVASCGIDWICIRRIVVTEVVDRVIAEVVAAVVPAVVSVVVVTRRWRCWRIIAGVGHRRRCRGWSCRRLRFLLLTLQSLNSCKQRLLCGRGHMFRDGGRFCFLQNYFNILHLAGLWRRDIGNIDLTVFVSPLVDVSPRACGDDQRCQDGEQRNEPQRAACKHRRSP